MVALDLRPAVADVAPALDAVVAALIFWPRAEDRAPTRDEAVPCGMARAWPGALERTPTDEVTGDDADLRPAAADLAPAMADDAAADAFRPGAALRTPDTEDAGSAADLAPEAADRAPTRDDAAALAALAVLAGAAPHA